MTKDEILDEKEEMIDYMQLQHMVHLVITGGAMLVIGLVIGIPVGIYLF